MLGFEPWICGVRCDCSTNCATATALKASLANIPRLELVPTTTSFIAH